MEKLSLKGQVLALAERVSSVRDAPMFSKAAAAEAALVDAVKLISHMCARIEALEAAAYAGRDA